MAALLSEGDFQCLQNQLLELKSKNYGLEEKNSKFFNEYTRINQQCSMLKEECEKAQKVINRSKNLQEIQILLKENDRLQRKLQSQEDEFRLQNETLMQEVLALTSKNDKLEKDLELIQTENNSPSEKSNDDDIFRLQAENNALKKLLQNSEGIPPVDGVDVSATLKAATESEEKFLLKEKILKQQKRHKEDILRLQSENEKLSEKLKRKQESVLQLHDEKEKMYTESQKQYQSLSLEKDQTIQNFRDEIQALQFQIKNTITCNEYNNKLSNDDGYSESEGTVQFIAGEKASFECSLNETKSKVRDYESKLNDLLNKVTESEEIIKQLQSEKLCLEESKMNIEKERNDTQLLLDEQSKLAEKRKIHMDEMNNHILEMSNKHSKEIENLTQQLLQEQEALQSLFHKEKETRLELLQAQNEIQSIRKELDHMKNEYTATQQGLKDADKANEELKLSFEEKSKQQNEEHDAIVKSLQEELKTQLQDFTIQIEVAQAEKVEFEEKASGLQQEVKDLIDEKRITEKKNSSLAKDLKRQLLTERKRAEKLQERLQERLQEVLNNQNRSIEDILQSSTADKPKGDASSISSWSYVPSEAAEREIRENLSHSDGSSCGRESPSCTSPGTLENETSNLLAKITHLQQKNWILDEKVNHLEMSNEALVDDLLKKTALIQFYCMEGRSNSCASGAQDKLTIKRIVDFIKDKGDENLREVNRKMQRMLEETLTKNMHLQKDIETLSNEIARLTDAKSNSILESAVIINNE